MKIVVLDGYAMNPGDLDWAPLEALGECTIHDRTPDDLTVTRAQGADVLMTNKTPLPRDVLEQLPSLKFICVLATGHNVVDSEAARERGVVVSNVPAYSTMSVAQMVFAHVLNFCTHVGEHTQTVRAGKWTEAEDFCYWDYPLVELSGLTMGIVGFGRIGQSVARMALAFDMQVIAVGNRTPPDMDGVRAVDLSTVFRESDVVTLHCPLTPETAGMVDAERLATMKANAFLVNTSRGPVVDEQALADALNSDRIAGAGVDVLSSEPPAADNPLLSAKNCYLTPHVAWATRAARIRLLEVVVANTVAFDEGKPQNVVN